MSASSRVQHYVNLVRDYDEEIVSNVRVRLYSACAALYDALTDEEREFARAILERRKEG